MLFTRFALAALPLIGAAFGSPVKVDESSREVARANPITSVISTLESNIAGPVTSLKTANSAGTLTVADCQTWITEICSTIQITIVEVGSCTGSSADLEIVGPVIAEVINDVFGVIGEIEVSIQTEVEIALLITQCDNLLHTLLLDVNVIVVGVIGIVSGLVTGVAGILGGLVGGLLGGLLGL